MTASDSRADPPAATWSAGQRFASHRIADHKVAQPWVMQDRPGLVFGTRAQHGLWAFADSVAQATEAWWATLEERTIEQEPGTLFPVTQVERPSLETIKTKALAEIEINLELLLRDYPSFKVVDHTLRVFGSYYGQVRDSLVRQAIKNMHRDGRTSSDGVGRRIRELTVARPQAEAARGSGISS